MSQSWSFFFVVGVTALPQIAWHNTFSTMSPELHAVRDRFAWTRVKSTNCSTENPPPVARLTAMGNSGMTWLQYLFEEITHIATQNPQSVPLANPFMPHLFLDEEVSLRTQCGAQLLLHPNCTSGSKEASGVRLAMGDEIEIYKNHYPAFDKPMALFETTPPVPKTLLVIRNPIDAYLARSRHAATDDPQKVGSGKREDVPPHALPLSDVRATMRNSTIGHGIDPLGIFIRGAKDPMNYQSFLMNWVDFFNFWLADVESACTEITVVRYEDLCSVNSTENVLEELLAMVGMAPMSEDAIQRAVEKYPPDPLRLAHDVYFNKSLALNSNVKAMVTTTRNAEIQLIETFGYRQFLDHL